MSIVPSSRRNGLTQHTGLRAGLFLFLAAAGVAAACEPLSSPELASSRNETTGGTGAIGGRVTDLEGNPVPNALVRTASGRETRTGPGGEFAFDGLAATERLAVSVETDRYGTTTEVFPVVPGQRLTRPIQLVERSAPVQIDAAAGGVVPIVGGGSIRIPAGSLVNAAGNPVAGPVAVRTTYWDPSSPAQVNAAPGDFTAVEQNGTPSRLQTFGMLETVATDAAGQPVELAPRATAVIDFPIRNNLGGIPPQLYDFDPQTGTWVGVGGSVVTSNNTVQVRVPSLRPRRNLDRPIVSVCIGVKVQKIGGAPRPYEFVTANAVSYSGSSNDWTDANGIAELWMDNLEVISIQAGPVSQTINTPQSTVGCPVLATLTY